jgi:segregation and condensation protein B
MTTEEPTVDKSTPSPAPEPGAPTQEVAARAEASGRSDEEAAAELEATEAEASEPESEAVPPVGEGHEAPERLKSIIESLLFASDKPLPIRRLVELTGERMIEMVTAAIEALRADYADRGVVLHEVAGGYQFRTNPINAHWVQQLVAGKPVKLSRAQLETLAICAYRQPITRPEIDEIRGVDSGATLKALLDRSLVRVLGKKEEAGRPMLYGTTKEFLEFFNLKDLKDLPTLREFYELNAESMEKIKKLDAQRAADAAAKEAKDQPEGSNDK